MGRIEKYVSRLFFFGWVSKGIRPNSSISVSETNNTGGGQPFYHTVGRNTPVKFHYSFSRQNDEEMVAMLSDRAHALSSICKSTAKMYVSKS